MQITLVGADCGIPFEYGSENRVSEEKFFAFLILAESRERNAYKSIDKCLIVAIMKNVRVGGHTDAENQHATTSKL
jgi:hypothetical protein